MRIAQKYTVAIKEILDDNSGLAETKVLEELKRAFLPAADDWPGDFRMLSKIYGVRKNQSGVNEAGMHPRCGQRAMAPKYGDPITEMLRKDIKVRPAEILSELKRRFGNANDNSLPEDWPGDSKINNRIRNKRHELRRLQRT